MFSAISCSAEYKTFSRDTDPSWPVLRLPIEALARISAHPWPQQERLKRPSRGFAKRRRVEKAKRIKYIGICWN